MNNIYAGISLATLTTWLLEAQNAYHKLAVGARVVSLSIGDKRVAFSEAEIPALRSHIVSLQTAISIARGDSAGKPYSVATWTR